MKDMKDEMKDKKDEMMGKLAKVDKQALLQNKKFVYGAVAVLVLLIAFLFMGGDDPAKEAAKMAQIAQENAEKASAQAEAEAKKAEMEAEKKAEMAKNDAKKESTAKKEAPAKKAAPAKISGTVVFKGANQSPENVVAVYQSNKFYSDLEKTKLLVAHPGNVVKQTPETADEAADHRLMGGRIYDGWTLDKGKCIATIVETKTRKGNVEEAVIYDGYAIARDFVRVTPESGVEVVESFNITKDGLTETKDPVYVLYRIKDKKIYKGDSTDDKDLVLSYTGDINSSRLLYLATEFGAK